MNWQLRTGLWLTIAALAHVAVSPYYPWIEQGVRFW